MRSEIFEIAHDLADIWIATDNQPGTDYSYGGTRMVAPDTDDSEVHKILRRLMIYESALKNRLINIALGKGVLAAYADRIPQGFLESTVGGARCIIRPREQALTAALKNPEHSEFHTITSRIFESIGTLLNQQEGQIKLTPDFGRFAGLAGILARYTPHALGIRCEDGGCGGKSSYSSTGIIGALETIGIANHKHDLITLIGSAGAMGSDVLNYLLGEGFDDIVVCDLVYNDGVVPPGKLVKLPSSEKVFTDTCLMGGGVIVATTLGQELEHSNWQLIPPGTILLLAHNLAVPEGAKGASLMRQIADRGVLALPGQILTLGGALTSRLEWFWRQSNAAQPFDKPLAHMVVRAVVTFLVAEILDLSRSSRMTPYETMLHYVYHPAVDFQESISK
jgi:hypothetical protein